MSKRKGRRAGSSKAGRPRQDGDRYPSGKLRPPKPNPRVVQRRLALAPDITMASCPLDAALSNGWISEQDHRAGVLFGRLFNQSGIGGPAIPVGSFPEVTTTMLEVDAETEVRLRTARLADLPDRIIAAMWEGAFGDSAGPADDGEERAHRAFTAYKAVNAAMTPDVRVVMFQVCARDHWPAWLLARAAGKDETPEHRLERARLLTGCAVVRQVLKARRPAVPANDPRPERGRGHGPVVEEVTRYVDEEGRQLFEAVRRGRRA